MLLCLIAIATPYRYNLFCAVLQSKCFYSLETFLGKTCVQVLVVTFSPGQSEIFVPWSSVYVW